MPHRPPSATRSDTLCPATTLCLSCSPSSWASSWSPASGASGCRRCRGCSAVSRSRSDSSPESELTEGTLRPSDHASSPDPADAPDGDITSPALGFVGWLRWGWRQLTSMRTALVLLLLLAIAAVPGSIVPQRSTAPNGVTPALTNQPHLT